MSNKTFNFNPTGKWSLESVQSEYRELARRFAVADGFELAPRTYSNSHGTWIYNIMDSVADGVRLGDGPSLELAIRYIEDDSLDLWSGYIRARMARDLRHVSLSDAQQARLARNFIDRLFYRRVRQEFREYIRLFRVIGVAPYRQELERLRSTHEAYIRRAVERLLA